MAPLSYFACLTRQSDTRACTSVHIQGDAVKRAHAGTQQSHLANNVEQPVGLSHYS